MTVPTSLPSSSRLKHCPWYPKKMLLQLQEKMDELEAKGALARPQDHNINVEAVSPSFLVAKRPASRGHRLVTAFGHLASHVKNPAAPMTSTDQVLKRLSAAQMLITADITMSYHQIPLAKESMKYAGIASPFKGVRVYTTAAMGMPGSEFALSELTAALFGKLRMEGIIEILMDDLYVLADSEEALLKNWKRVLEICNNADIRLSPTKVSIAPRQTKILGWTWTRGVLEADEHASNRLQKCDPPKTAEGLRGWVGAYRFMAPTIPEHAIYLEPLHRAIGDKSKSDPIEWTEELKTAFKTAQESLKLVQPLCIPRHGEQLYLTTDASQKGLGATLHRASDRAVVRYFSKQLSADKQRWLPCELESLGVGAALQAFLPFFRESGCKPIIYTDSTPVVMAYNKLQKGEFSASPRVSTFLHEVVNQGAIVKYLAGHTNLAADHASRNAAPCESSGRCQVCNWIFEKEAQVVRRYTPEETQAIIAGNSPLPFQSRLYWRKRQLEDKTLRQVCYYLKYGAIPPKYKHLQQVKHYLQPRHGIFLSSDNVLLAPSVKEFCNTPRFVVPQEATTALISIFHQQFGCLAATPLRDLLRRHFFVFDLDKAVTDYVQSCMSCAAKRDKKHVEQPMSSVEPPKFFGEHFASDIIQRNKQKILLLRETATSHTWAKLIQNEKTTTLLEGFRHLFAQVRPPNAARPSTCRVDNAPALQSISMNEKLADIGVDFDLGNKANKNSNPVAEKANKEMHAAIVSTVPNTAKKITEAQLQSAVALMNSKPRWSTMSSVELWTGRDMITGDSLWFQQKDIIAEQHRRREQSHPKNATPIPSFKPGQIVFANSEGNKLRARDQLIVREDLGNGMYRLDRVKASGRITRAFLPARDLYTVQEAPQESTEPDLVEAPEAVVPEEGLATVQAADSPNDSDLFAETPTPADPPSPEAKDPGEEPHEGQPTQQLTPERPKRPIPPEPGMARFYRTPKPAQPIYIPFYFPLDAFDQPPGSLTPESSTLTRTPSPSSSTPPTANRSPANPMEERDDQENPSLPTSPALSSTRNRSSDVTGSENEEAQDFSTAESQFSTDQDSKATKDDRTGAGTERPACPRPSPPQQPVIKRQRSGSAPPHHERPKRNPRMPVQLQYTAGFKQELTTQRVEVPENPEPVTPVKKRHSKEKKQGWCEKRAKSKKPTDL